MTEYFDMVKVSVGSYYAGPTQGVQQGCGGMPWATQCLLLPHLIGIEKDDRTFREAVTVFWAEINTNIPINGIELEIGLEEDNDKPVSKDNMPINVAEFVKFIHHRGHPNMGRNEAEARGNQLMLYYLFDPMELEKEKSKKSSSENAALAVFLKLIHEPEKMDMMLSMFGEDSREYEQGKSEIEWKSKKEQRLKTLATSQSDLFIKHYETEDLEIRFWIARMIRLDVFTEVGTQIRAKESKALIGHTTGEAVAYFQNPENQEIIMMFKQLAQEAARKPIIATERKTVLTARQLAGKNGQ